MSQEPDTDIAQPAGREESRLVSTDFRNVSSRLSHPSMHTEVDSVQRLLCRFRGGNVSLHR